MAHFFKPDSGDRVGYDGGLNKQYIEVGRASSVALYGGGDNEKLAVVLNDPSIGKPTEVLPEPPDVRHFVIRGDRLGNAMLEARNKAGAVWAFMQIEVVEALPGLAPPASATPGGAKTTIRKAKPQDTSPQGRQWIKNSEGLKLEYYDIDSQAAMTDPSKRNCTVGWGHLVHRRACRPEDGEVGSITLEQAQAYFDSDVSMKEVYINSKRLSLTQTEFDALVDMAFQSWRQDVEEALRAGDKEKVGELLASRDGERGARRKILWSEGRYVDRGQK